MDRIANVDTGKMQQIRELLAQGRSSSEVIAMGFAPGTVYKVQRRLRSGATPAALVPAVGADPVAVMGQPQPRQEEVEKEIGSLRDQVEVALALQPELDDLRRQIGRLEEEVSRVQAGCTRCSSDHRARIEALEHKAIPLEEQLQAVQRGLSWVGDVMGPAIVVLLHIEGHVHGKRRGGFVELALAGDGLDVGDKNTERAVGRLEEARRALAGIASQRTGRASLRPVTPAA